MEGIHMKIVCFGDSLTRGVTFVKGRLRILKANYPAFLEDQFAKTNQNDVTVVNKGVFNAHSDGLLDRLEKDVLSESPDIVIVGIGGNDCDFRWDEVAEKPDDHHEPKVPLDRYLDNVKNMLAQIQNAGILPLVATLPPLDPVRYYKTISERTSTMVSHLVSTLGGIEHWHGKYNRHLNTFLDTTDIGKIDVRTAIKKAGDLKHLISDDGIHLTKEGYRVYSQEVFQSLQKHLLIKTI